MATRDCIEARLPGSRSYPIRPQCGLPFDWQFSALAVRESRPPPETGPELLGRFSDARDFLQCGLTALIARDERCFYSSEAACLQHGLDLLREAYNDLDRWLIREHRPAQNLE